MARAAKHTGPSITKAEAADPVPPKRPPEVITEGQSFRIRRAEIGYIDRKEEKPSVGDNSSQSSENAETKQGSERPLPRKRAHTTENPSDQQAKETDSTAHSTDGDGPRKTTRPSANRRSTANDPFDDDF